MRRHGSILAAAAAAFTTAVAMAAPPQKADRAAPCCDQHDWMIGARAIEPDAAIKSALSAAPAGLAQGAAVVAAAPGGAMRSLRPGSNGFTCMPDNPATPGPDPMCADANGMEWVTALLGRQAPPAKVGLIYMLAGGTVVSESDPYARRPAAGKGWVTTGPHLMVVGSAGLLHNYPAGGTSDTGLPYVMWAGTPYAHLKIPVR